MADATPSDPTRLLEALGHGDEAAAEQLLPLVWSELRGLASGYLAHERADHTLQPTALVHEAWLRMFEGTSLGAEHRQHFLGLAARAMRRVLVDHARKHRALRRGGPQQRRMPLDAELLAGPSGDLDVLDVHEALERFAQVDPRASRVVELRFFGGLSQDEAAEVLGVTGRTVQNDWYTARAWLSRELRRGEDP